MEGDDSLPAEPFIPENITVHLGAPGDAKARNVTMSFRDYIKNVASSEIYPTWPEEALKANILAIISYTLNRFYTKWYRSQGYDFDITNSTQYDHFFVYGRNVFEPISVLVDEMFDDYIRREDHIEPLFAAYCDGRRTMCDGLLQWGSADLAARGYSYIDILKHYYGDNIYIVYNAKERPIEVLYRDEPLKFGDRNNYVGWLQHMLNRISANYPAIPKIAPSDLAYDTETEMAVRKFQEIFDLPVTGITDQTTWKKVEYIHTAVKKLAELNSEGLTAKEINAPFPETLSLGNSGPAVRKLQYLLGVVGAYYRDVQPLTHTGTFDEQTETSVRSFQRVFGLPQDGVVDNDTLNDIYRAYIGITEAVPVDPDAVNAVLFPGTDLSEGSSNEYVKVLQQYLTYIHGTYPNIPEVTDTGYFGPLTKNSVVAFQKQFGLPDHGRVDVDTWDAVSDVYTELRHGYVKNPGQYPGFVIT